MWKDSERERHFSRPEYTAQDIIRDYTLKEQPLGGETIYQLLEPLAGTSFMAKALRELGIHFHRQRQLAFQIVFPSDLLDFWFGDIYPHQVERVADPKQIDGATIAIHSHSTHAIGVDTLYTVHWLQDPSEMLLYQGRWDKVYHDQERKREAFTHLTEQLQFYKGGTHLHTLPESKIQYTGEWGTWENHTLLPDGTFDTTFFIDERRRPFNALPPEQQQFTWGFRILHIGLFFFLRRGQEK